MAYSRWLHTNWYIYQSIYSGPTKDEKRLEVYFIGAPNLTHIKYGGFNEGVEGTVFEDEFTRVMGEVVKFYTDQGCKLTDKDKDELRSHLRDWVVDVCDEFDAKEGA